MSEPFLGEIMMFAGNFAPRGWAMCNGQILPIAQNTALFSILGTTYGGNGQTTFALPDLRGRVPMHFGQGPGLSARTLGEQGGEESVTLIQAQLPQHSHTANATSADATSSKPDGAVPASGGAYAPASDGTTMSPGFITGGGGNQPHDNMQPYLAINFVIALEGIFPSRN
ncbi:MAG: tail fiber protein [Actinomycetota bacterium]|nr:tail fiber protein [Actinomycetota bacterium]